MLDKYLTRAIELAKTSKMGQKHGAILFSNGQVYSNGINTSNRSRINRMTVPSVHAEMDCLTRSPIKKPRYLKGLRVRPQKI